MGYSLTIGELKVEYDQSDEEFPSIFLSAEGATSDDPNLYVGEPTDGQNQRWPSYSVWAQFTRDVGLYSLFFEEDNAEGLLTRHPGCIPLTEYHRKEINKAYDAFMKKHPHATPTYGKPPPDDCGITALMWEDPDNPKENSQLVRLYWLHYWVNWAMDNCERPVFANT